jgi:phosphoserine phosphatase
MNEGLPSWNNGRAKESILKFIARVTAEGEPDFVPANERVAVFDNDGTLWCEKPNYPQLDFLVTELRLRVGERSEMAERPEYAAILAGDRAAMAELGLERIGLALLELFAKLTPEEFEERARDFIMNATHPKLGAPYARAVYRPMLELLDFLRAHEFAAFIVSGGGTEFVRAVSRELYGVNSECVVGTLVAYEFVRRDGEPVLLRTARAHGEVNEGPAKVSHIRTQLGRRPIFAAGNSAGDREMLEYAAAAPGRGMALLVDHDDSEREYAYASEAGSFTADEPILETAQGLGWTVVSIKNDWATVFG